MIYLPLGSPQATQHKHQATWHRKKFRNKINIKYSLLHSTFFPNTMAYPNPHPPCPNPNHHSACPNTVTAAAISAPIVCHMIVYHQTGTYSATTGIVELSPRTMTTFTTGTSPGVTCLAIYQRPQVVVLQQGPGVVIIPVVVCSGNSNIGNVNVGQGGGFLPAARGVQPGVMAPSVGVRLGSVCVMPNGMYVSCDWVGN